MEMNFKSILDDIGSKLKEFFTKAAPVAAVVEQVAVAAEPFVDIAFPGSGALYNTVVGAVGQAETGAIAAGVQSGTGPQKLAAVLGNSQVVQAFKTIEAAGGVAPTTTAQQTAYINAVVATLKALPAVTA